MSFLDSLSRIPILEWFFKPTTTDIIAKEQRRAIEFRYKTLKTI